MMSMADNRTTFYFNPLTQAISTDLSDRSTKVIHVVITHEYKEIVKDKLPGIIQMIGNHVAIGAVKHKSYDTEQNYCTDYREHPTCEQRSWSYCKRHLTPEEMQECDNLLQQTSLSKLDPYPKECGGASMHGFIERGEVLFMRQIISSVKQALQG